MKFFSFIVFLLLSIISSEIAATTKYSKSKVSLIKLIIEPSEYEGHDIISSGFMIVASQQITKLYINKDAFYANSPDYLVVDGLPDENRTEIISSCQGGCFVSVLGTFEYSKFNSPVDLIGVIENTQKIVLWNEHHMK